MNRDGNRHHHGSANYHSAERGRAYQLRREREIGDWGRASEHIGRRWEQLGFQRLASMLEKGQRWPTDQHQPRALVPLMNDLHIQSALTRIGLPSPDVVVVLSNCSRGLTLQALDFKWDLEFAGYDQIRAGALHALLERDHGVLRDAFVRAAGGPLLDRSCLDGFLFAPDSPANRRFLSSAANQRQEYPIAAHEVIFAAVQPEEFFSPLPGWELAIRLADIDRSTHSLRYLDTGERYYRLGAGLMGAAAQLQSSIFDAHPPPVDAEATMAWFRAQVRPLSSAFVVRHTEQLMAVRARHLEQLRRLTRSPYRFSDLTHALARRGILLPEAIEGAPPSAEHERWRSVLRRVSAEYRAIVLRAGRQLVGGGLDDAEALARLPSEARRYNHMAQSIAGRLIESELSES